MKGIYTVLGSGFGLYGYVPALIDGFSVKVVLPLRYQEPFLKRPELARYIEVIDWVAGEEEALAAADSVVVALRPADQEERVRACLSSVSIRHFILEKPLAHSPLAAKGLLDALVASGNEFRIGHNFQFTHWGIGFQDLLRSLPAGRHVVIQWAFHAHHHRHGLETWKRLTSAGGGALRFYGIHLIALLVECGYGVVDRSSSWGPAGDEMDGWTATFRGAGLPSCEVVVDARAVSDRFNISLTSGAAGSPAERLVELCDPYGLEDGDEQMPPGDRRISLLIRMLNSPLGDPGSRALSTTRIIKLWSEVEMGNHHSSAMGYPKRDER